MTDQGRPKNLRELPLRELRTDPRNSNVMPLDRYQKALGHMRSTGNYPTIIVRQLPNNSRYWDPKGGPEQIMLLDGHHRARMQGDLGREYVMTDDWGIMSDEDAGLYLLTLNRNVGEDDPLRRAELVVDISRTYALEDIAAVVPEEIVDLRTLVDLQQIGLGVQAVAGLDDEDEAPASGVPELDTETVMPVRFALYPAQHQTVMTALLHIQAELEGRNKPARALELLCADYLAGLSEAEQATARVVYLSTYGEKNSGFAGAQADATDATFTEIPDEGERPVVRAGALEGGAKTGPRGALGAPTPDPEGDAPEDEE